MDDFNCDIAHVLQNRDFSVLQKLISHCYDFRAKVAAKVEDVTAYEIECLGKKTQNVNQISELQQEIEHLKADIDATNLNRKIVDKKIANAIEQREQLKKEVEEAKLKRDSLSLEMIDLQQESDKRKEQKLMTWNALKLACHTYKQYLDFRIHLLDSKEHDEIKVSFFITDPIAKDNYFVHLVNFCNQWRLELIQPKLKPEHLKEFKEIIDFSKQSEISDVTAFLSSLLIPRFFKGLFLRLLKLFVIRLKPLLLKTNIGIALLHIKDLQQYTLQTLHWYDLLKI